jgi:choline dehydrogenase
MPGGLFAMPEKAFGLTWGIMTVPQKHLNGRVLPMFRGKIVGGSSAINATLCIRGCKRDYDSWG